MQNVFTINQATQLSNSGNIQHSHHSPYNEKDIDVLVYNNMDYLEVLDGTRSQTGSIQVIGCGDVIVGSGCTGQD